MDIQNELLAEFDREAAKTRKLLEAIPADADFAFKPHPKSMPLGNLAGHITDMTGDWALHTLTKDKLEFPADHKWEQYVPESKAALLEKFDRELAGVRAALAAVPQQKWDEHWQFIFGGQKWIDQPRYQVFRDMVMNHLVHHRAQLGVYVRMVGGKVPGSYGPSADEM
ncbi:MAG: DinB family protein [Acidobacteriota bacterium]|nr:DinB family protein [Acidobacteriota bacterium]